MGLAAPAGHGAHTYICALAMLCPSTHAHLFEVSVEPAIWLHAIAPAAVAKGFVSSSTWTPYAS